MVEIENSKDECELKTWELIKIARKKLKEFRIKKEEELERELVRVRITFFGDLSKQEIEKIKWKIKNKEEIEEISKNLEKITELDERVIRYETNKLLCDLSMKKELK